MVWWRLFRCFTQNTGESTGGFETLPPDMVRHIASFLDTADAVRLQATSSNVRAAVGEVVTAKLSRDACAFAAQCALALEAARMLLQGYALGPMMRLGGTAMYATTVPGFCVSYREYIVDEHFAPFYLARNLRRTITAPHFGASVSIEQKLTGVAVTLAFPDVTYRLDLLLGVVQRVTMQCKKQKPQFQGVHHTLLQKRGQHLQQTHHVLRAQRFLHLLHQPF